MSLTIDEVRSLGDVVQTHKWDLVFAKFPRVGSYPSAASLNLRCVSATVPKKTSTPIPVTLRGHTVKHPGIFVPDQSITLNFIESIDQAILNFFLEWREACSETGTLIQNEKQDVEAIIQLIRLDRQNVPIWLYELYGCFIQAYDVDNFDANAGKALAPTLTLSYDDFSEWAL